MSLVTRHQPYSIADFLTDGSLPRLAAALSTLAAATVTLFGRRGERILPADGSPPWRVVDDGLDEAVAGALASADPVQMITDVPGRGELVLLHVGGCCIGGLMIESIAPPAENPEFRKKLRTVLAHIAATVSERCGEEALLRERNDELSMLFRVSSLLVGAQDLDETLSVALDACARILAADAGVVHLIDGEHRHLVRRAQCGLSDDFLGAFDRLESPRGADPEALRGGVLAVSDLASHAGASAALTRIAEAEGLRSMLSCGLVFKDRPLGVLRLFTTEPARFSSADQALMRSLSEQISAAVEAARLGELNRRNRAIRRQVKLASDVQRRLLPVALPQHPRLDIASRYIPSSELGGDFYDLIDLGGWLGLVVGDVVGKGVPAALLMASVRGSFRAHAQRLTRRDSVEEVIARVNRTLAGDTRPNEFATGFLARIDLKTLEVIYCNAGHDPPFVAPAAGVVAEPTVDDIFELTTGGPLMGVADDYAYERSTHRLHTGDTLVAYTDGICDAMDFEHRKFGRDRVKAAVVERLAADPHCTASDIADHVIWEVRRFTGLNTERDDLTLVVLRAREDAAPND